jgi:hypothetical protein
MGKVIKSPAVCNYCGETWDINNVGLCPKCGKGSKLIKLNIQNVIFFKGSISLVEFYNNNKLILIFNISIIAITCLISLIFAEPFVTIICSIISFLYLIYGPSAITIIRENKKWKLKLSRIKK